jgi:hypothetical protein
MYSPKLVIMDGAARAARVASLAKLYSPECAQAITALASTLPPEETAGLLAVIGTVTDEAITMSLDEKAEAQERFFGLCGGLEPWTRHLWVQAEDVDTCPKDCRFCQAQPV